MNRKNQEQKMFLINAWPMIFIFVLLIGGAIFQLIGNRSPAAPFIGIALIMLGLYLLKRFRIIQPNTAIVATRFGHYAGSWTRPGFVWLPPFYEISTVSMKTSNHSTSTIKVNDSSGTPIEVAAAIVYHINNPAAATLDVEDPQLFLFVQSESALRTLASTYPYTAPDNQDSLSRHSNHILDRFVEMLQERVDAAGIRIEEARFTHLAYASEIAQAMLRKQQAEAVVAARETLVRGAIDMVDNTVAELSRRGIVHMSEQDKAKLVINMMTVLLSEENASPVLNVSGGN
ncbi:MAG: SPFH domain-containing protein [Neisseria sp.]|nr:SPFH domain-containing protein [Neisseria sp.]